MGGEKDSGSSSSDPQHLILEVQGIRAAKGDASKELLESGATAVCIVADVGGLGKYTHYSSHVKPTRKTLNTFKTSVRLPAAAGSSLRSFLAKALRSSDKADADVHLIVYALNEGQAAALEASKSGAVDLGLEIGRARASLRTVLDGHPSGGGTPMELRHANVPLKSKAGGELGSVVVSTTDAVVLLKQISESGGADAAASGGEESKAGGGGGGKKEKEGSAVLAKMWM